MLNRSICAVHTQISGCIYILYNIMSFTVHIKLNVQMVVYEAARSLINLKNVTAREIQPAVSG